MSFTVTVIGGTGVFGRYIVQELLNSPLDLVLRVAARQPKASARCFPPSSPRLQFQRLDLNDRTALAALLQQSDLVILAAGPFQEFDTHVAEMCAERGIHYLDICDDPVYVAKLFHRQGAFSRSQSVLLTGLSSLPGISLPLADLILPKFDAVKDVAIGLFIGNRNPKGHGAVFSAVKNLQRPVTFLQNGEQKEVASWSQPLDYAYPPPIGEVRSYAFASPDPLLFPRYFPIKNLSVRVGFEWFATRWTFSLLRKWVDAGGQAWVETAVSALFPFFSLAGRVGSERGCVSVTVSGTKEGRPHKVRASLLALEKGQKMASLPCVLAAEALAKGEIPARGLLDLHRWMPPAEFFARLKRWNMQTIVEEIVG